MPVTLIKIPVRCPECGLRREWGFNAAEIAQALLDSRPMRLYASCHDIVWFAGLDEVADIRELIHQEAHKVGRLNPKN